ncbi:COX assembly mitochondrial protein homolog [Diretmus argenteus]
MHRYGENGDGLSVCLSSSEEPHLRHVETDVLIPKMMRDKARELCAEKVEAFNHCCKDSGVLMVFKCREENSALKECLTLHYTDKAFFEECKQEYIQEKLEYERTGIPAKNRKQKLPTSM